MNECGLAWNCEYDKDNCCLQTHRLNNNSDGMKHLGDTVAGLQSLDSKVQSLEPRLDALEEATKKLDALDKVTKSTDSILASQSLSLETFNQKVEVLLADFDEQHEKLHSLEEQVKHHFHGFYN